jgi:hypothetical protein
MSPRYILLFCALCWGPSVWPQDSDIDATEPAATEDSGQDTRGYLTFYLDNDLFSGTDKDYTNGARVSWISENHPAFGFLPARPVLEKLSGADEAGSLIRRLSGFEEGDIERGNVVLNYGLSITQLMFTPTDFRSPVQPPGQRRYAGWLGLGFSIHAKNERVLNSAELIFGTLGPRSYAKEAQDFIHDLIGVPRFQGWADQIPNEFTLDLFLVQKRRVRFLERPERNLSMDGFTEWGARLGTFRTLARAGGFFRVGFHLPADFSDPRIDAAAYSHRFFEHGRKTDSDWSLYALGGAKASAVLFDATLDGPLFSDFETGNTRQTWVGDVYLGFGARWKWLELSYVHTLRSEEYKEQSGWSNFGSVALLLRL